MVDVFETEASGQVVAMRSAILNKTHTQNCDLEPFRRIAMAANHFVWFVCVFIFIVS
jgi:hypothetical protein